MSDSFLETWRRFVAEPRTKPSRAARGDGASSDYLVYLIALDRHQSIARAAHHLQAHLGFPYVSPVPREALHITVQGLDLRDNLTSEQQASLVEGAARALASLPPLEVTVGGANSFDVAAFLEVRDGGVLREARARLREALPWLAEASRDPLLRGGHDVYLPHVSIAYYNAEAEASGIVEALAPHRDEVVARVRVSSMKLVAVRLPLPTTRVRYKVEATFPLRGR